MLLVAVGGAEHQEHALLRLERDVTDAPGFGDPPRRHADRRDPARIFLERLQPRDRAALHERELVRMCEQRPHCAGNGVARLVLAARDRKLDVGAHAFHRHAAVQHHPEQAEVRLLRQHRHHVVDRSIDAGSGGMAARLDGGIAGVIGDAVDHALRPRVHVLEAHVGQPRDRLQAFGRERQRKCLHEIDRRLRFERGDDAVGMRLELRCPVRLHRLRRDRRKDRLALGQMRIAILAHHVVAHQLVHQPLRLVRREHVDLLFRDENVVAAAQQRAAQLRHEGDRRFLPKARQHGVGVLPEGGGIDVDAGSGAHGVSLKSFEGP